MIAATLLALSTLGAAPADGGRSPQQRALDAFVGRWECAGTSDGQPVTSTLRVRSTLAGAWLDVEYAQTTPRDPRAPRTRELWGWDAGQKAYVRFAARADGASTSTSAGWTGDTFAWEVSGAHDGAPWRARTTFVRAADGRSMTLKTTEVVEGAERVLFEGRCAK